MSVDERGMKKPAGQNLHFRGRKLGRRLKTELEGIIAVIEKLKHEADEDTVILVEGQRDKQALQQLGITGRILSLREFRNEVRVYLNAERVILLLDFDEEGVEMYKRVRTRLEQQGFKVEPFYYRRLCEMRRFGVYTVEEMGRYLNRVL